MVHDVEYGRLLGAEADAHGGTRFTLWTSHAKTCALRLFEDGGSRTLPMTPAGEGFFELEAPDVTHGARYAFVLDDQQVRDPYAKHLPEGPGFDTPAVVWRSRYAWKHPAPARPLGEHVIYEIHVGTFTREGTFRAAAAELRDLAELGVTAIELMPIASFPGARGWGYDGVAHYAPFAPYGDPDELRAFVDAAHGLGLAVILDVVYNHLGPDGNVLYAYGPEYFTSAHRTPWGDAPNFGHHSMRRYAVRSVRTWLEDFRFDGLRFDAVHEIWDESERHVLTELAAEAARLEPKRLLFAEDDRNDPKILRHHGFDGVWADDFHHQVRVALTGEQDGYYAAYTGSVADLAKTIEQGWFYRGETYPPTGKPRGKDPEGVAPSALVYCIQNHDQVGNRAFGDRITELVPRESFAAAAMLLLFLPVTPLLFMGQEWGASTPFLYFTDHAEELGRRITAGRREEFRNFDSFGDDASHGTVPDPQSSSTFERSRLDRAERAAPGHAHVLAIHRAMLRLRANDPVLRSGGTARAWAEGDVLVVERVSGEHVRRLVLNLGPSRDDVGAPPGSELLVASHEGASLGGPLVAKSALLVSCTPAK